MFNEISSKTIYIRSMCSFYPLSSTSPHDTLSIAADPKLSCRLAPIAVTPGSFNLRGSQTLINWFPENNTVGLALLGIANPTLISLYPTFYGMTSASLWVQTKVGANTAFYVSSTSTTASMHVSHVCVARCCHNVCGLLASRPELRG
jgi:hypothetical protein